MAKAMEDIEISPVGDSNKPPLISTKAATIGIASGINSQDAVRYINIQRTQTLGRKIFTAGEQTARKMSSKKLLRKQSHYHYRNLSVNELVNRLVNRPIKLMDETDGLDNNNDNNYSTLRSDLTIEENVLKVFDDKADIKKLTRPLKDKILIKKLIEQENKSIIVDKKTKSCFEEMSKICKVLKLPTFKSLEGRLGMGTTSFFYLVRSVILINIMILLLLFVFLTLPQLIYSSSGSQGNVTFNGKELILGTDSFEWSVLYYGYCSSEDTNPVYNIKKAYFLTMCLAYGLVLILLSINFSSSFKRSYYNTKGLDSNIDASIIFCSWDFNITDPKMAALKSNSIFIDLKTLTLEYNLKNTKFTKMKQQLYFLLKVLVNVIIISSLLASPLTLFYACVSVSDKPDSLAARLGVPTLLTCLNYGMPLFFSFLGQFEKYRSFRRSVYLIVIRTGFIQAGNLAVMTHFWYMCYAFPTESFTIAEPYKLSCKRSACWETHIGTQLYVLMVLDFFMLIISLAFDLFKKFLYLNFHTRLKKYPRISSLLCPQEFDVGRLSVHVVYTQCLVWLSLYFSPLLSILAIFKLLIQFYSKKLSIKLGCYEPVKLWRLGHTTTFVHLLHLTLYLLCLSTFVYNVVYINPSSSCGPYREFNGSKVYDSLNAGPLTSTANIITDVLSSVGFKIFIYFIFGIIVFYSRAVAHGHEGLANQVKCQIQLEGKDRAFYNDKLKLWKRTVNIGQERVYEGLRKKNNRTHVNSAFVPIEGSQTNLNQSRNNLNAQVDPDEQQHQQHQQQLQQQQQHQPQHNPQQQHQQQKHHHQPPFAPHNTSTDRLIKNEISHEEIDQLFDYKDDDNDDDVLNGIHDNHETTIDIDSDFNVHYINTTPNVDDKKLL